MVFIFILTLAIIALLIFLFMNQPKMGKLPSGERLSRMEASPNFRDGKFQNINFTPMLAEGENFFQVFINFIFKRDKRNKPTAIIPSQKTNLKSLHPDEEVLVWFGHSSYFMQLSGKKILVDPVFSGAASPIAGTTKSFPGSDVYAPEDFPEIDFLFISHDHWDHLDYETILKLKPKIKKIITGLGTGAHLEHWGFNPQIIIEEDWNTTIDLGDGFVVHTTPARHFSGRSVIRNRALWLSFVLETPTKKIFLGGDSGYDTHFAKIGADFGPFDLAIVECGQYNKSWKNIHLLPEEMVTVALELKTKVVMPVHWAKFSLALHAWDEPIKLLSAAAQNANLPLLTPMIGEKVDLNAMQFGKCWWTNVN